MNLLSEQGIETRRPLIAASISDRELGLIDKTVLDSIDLIELRVDHFSKLSSEYISEVINKTKGFDKHLICTIRSTDEGGATHINDSERLRIFKEVAGLVDMIDIEAASEIFIDVLNIAKEKDKILIASIHNFDSTPSYRELEDTVLFNKSRGAHIVKIATMPQRREDIFSMTRLTVTYYRENIVTICMGQMGVITRVFFPFIGSLFTFASVGETKAPGQMDVRRLRELMNLFSGS
ncbi:MAG: type I 3-dehydroquinate dehydratase [Nitrospirae bacterium]|nr:type I 3-dehydroquinate dehydratase [Nitrospirota bacterium]